MPLLLWRTCSRVTNTPHKGGVLAALCSTEWAAAPGGARQGSAVPARPHMVQQHTQDGLRAVGWCSVGLVDGLQMCILVGAAV
jgi:hypothetical protein